MRYLLPLPALAGCGGTQWTPEEQGAYIKRCEANGMDWHIFDFGRIICHKKEG